jgi:hypothetical protein
MTALRQRLDPWLGTPRRKQSEGRMTMIYRFDSEIPPVTPLRLKSVFHRSPGDLAQYPAVARAASSPGTRTHRSR